jgi:hypothetical protein
MNHWYWTYEIPKQRIARGFNRRQTNKDKHGQLQDREFGKMMARTSSNIYEFITGSNTSTESTTFRENRVFNLTMNFIIFIFCFKLLFFTSHGSRTFNLLMVRNFILCIVLYFSRYMRLSWKAQIRECVAKLQHYNSLLHVRRRVAHLRRCSSHV